VRKGFAVIIGGAISLTASLLLARVHPFGDAGLYAASSTQTPVMDHASVPPVVRDLLSAKCADCHSTATKTPFYGHFAPVSWLLERDIVRGRAEMNLSQWSSYTPAQQQTFAAKIVQETKAHEMPLPQYRMIHWDSRVSDADVRTLSEWARGTASLEGGTGGDSGAPGDPAHGKVLFEKRCVGCHTLTENREGPLLQGVYGRTAGTAASFAYSSALKNSKMVWDDASLDKWLTDPDMFIPGNNMDFLISKAQDRRDIISYLRQVSGK